MGPPPPCPHFGPIYCLLSPQITRDIPKSPLPEWFVDASRQCLLPGLDDDDNISVSDPCQGGVITFSFCAKKENVVKLYLYFNGQCMRLMPEDVKVIFPCLFNMDYGDNKQWIESKEVDECIENMNEGLMDTEFAAFQQSYK